MFPALFEERLVVLHYSSVLGYAALLSANLSKACNLQFLSLLVWRASFETGGGGGDFYFYIFLSLTAC